VDAAAEIDAVGAVIDLDQHGQRMGGAAGCECVEHDTFERLIVLAEDEIAEPLANLHPDRR
jgi:hypothetical protein